MGLETNNSEDVVAQIVLYHHQLHRLRNRWEICYERWIRSVRSSYPAFIRRREEASRWRKLEEVIEDYKMKLHELKVKLKRLREDREVGRSPPYNELEQRLRRIADLMSEEIARRIILCARQSPTPALSGKSFSRRTKK